MIPSGNPPPPPPFTWTPSSFASSFISQHLRTTTLAALSIRVFTTATLATFNNSSFIRTRHSFFKDQIYSQIVGTSDRTRRDNHLLLEKPKKKGYLEKKEKRRSIDSFITRLILKRLFFSERRRGLCHIRQVCCRRDLRGSTGLLRCPSDGCPGRADDRSFGLEEFRAAIARAIALVGGPWRLRSLYDLRGHVQSNASEPSMTRGRLRAQSTEKRNAKLVALGRENE